MMQKRKPSAVAICCTTVDCCAFARPYSVTRALRVILRDALGDRIAVLGSRSGDDDGRSRIKPRDRLEQVPGCDDVRAIELVPITRRCAGEMDDRARRDLLQHRRGLVASVRSALSTPATGRGGQTPVTSTPRAWRRATTARPISPLDPVTRTFRAVTAGSGPDRARRPRSPPQDQPSAPCRASTHPSVGRAPLRTLV